MFVIRFVKPVLVLREVRGCVDEQNYAIDFDDNDDD